MFIRGGGGVVHRNAAGAPRMMLHARTLRLPVGEEGLEVSAPDPFRSGVLEGLSLQAAPAEQR